MRCELLKVNEEVVLELEQLRYNAYCFDFIRPSKYYKTNLLMNKMLAYGLIYDERIRAACYVSYSFCSLYIEQLFVDKIYQFKSNENSVSFGKTLLNFVLNDITFMEEYYKTTFDSCLLLPFSEELNDYYKKFGFQKEHPYSRMLVKQL